jgi:PRA1 family protein 1
MDCACFLLQSPFSSLSATKDAPLSHRITSPLLIVAVGFLVGGFIAINKFAPEPMQVGEHVVTQKSLYTILFCIGIPLLWIASPFALIFWLVGSSAIIVLGHAIFIEPPVSSEYSSVETV